jgi:L-lactate dehydrogenase complex protein LldF
VNITRERAKNIKWEAIENLDKYLLEFEQKITARGATVIWANDTAEAQEAIGKICKERNCKTLVKSKSMVTEEIHLNDFLEASGIESVETDLGEYIQQLDGEPPYHIVTPAMHKSKEDVAKLFANKLGTKPDLTPEELTQVARIKLREKYTEAEVGVTGANFLIADIGAIAITENEGNAGLTTSIPKIHIVIAGIDKLLPSLSDLDLFLPLLSTYGTGQTITAYNHIISGPRQSDEMDGPEELYVILLDNGRTNVLAQNTQRQALSCIQCGACQYACPVYRATTPGEFPSPVEAITVPLKTGDPDLQKLSYASTLCGACKDVCPVKIDLPKLLLQNRKDFVDQGHATRSEKLFYYVWKRAMLKRDRLNWKGIKAGKFIMENLYKSKDGLRKMPLKAPKSFNEQMREKRNIK